MANYIPSNDGQFEVWCNNLVEYVFVKVMTAPPVRTHIPKAETLSAADMPPKKVEELLHSAFATKSPLDLTFE
jgi:hypothetical protein